LRYPGPWNAASRGPAPGGGPTAVPGSYSARLTVGTYTATKSFTLKPDPRVVNDGVTVAIMQEQFDVGNRVMNLVSEANQLAAQIRENKRRLANATGAAADTLNKINSIEARLITPPIRYSKPELLTHITYLFGLTNQADQKIGKDVLDRYAFLKREFDKLAAEAIALLGRPITE
jgi:hypothetical protein